MSIGGEIVARELGRLNEKSQKGALDLDDTRRLVLLLKLEDPQPVAEDVSPWADVPEQVLHLVLASKKAAAGGG